MDLDFAQKHSFLGAVPFAILCVLLPLVLNYDHVMLGASKDLQWVDVLGDDHQHHNKSKGDEEDCGNVVGDLWHYD